MCVFLLKQSNIMSRKTNHILVFDEMFPISVQKML